MAVLNDCTCQHVGYCDGSCQHPNPMSGLDAKALAPCPFCGGSTVIVEKTIYGYGHTVSCDDCTAMVVSTAEPPIDSERDAVAIWNSRAVLPHAGKVSEELREAAQAVVDQKQSLIQPYRASPSPADAGEPDGETAVVPAKMFLNTEAIANLVFQLGGLEDGDADERWVDGVMWVGELPDDDGSSPVYGLHVYSTEYPEDGSVTLATFEPRSALPASPAKATPEVGDDPDEAYEIGKRDGYSEAVQQIDVLTGGDGEYRYCTDHDPDRHTPDPASMIRRIVERFQASSPSPADAGEPTREWRCFHCDEVFSEEQDAREHFGTLTVLGMPITDPACCVDIAEFRDMEYQLQRYRMEDSDKDREFHTIKANHASALIDEERALVPATSQAKGGAEEDGPVPTYECDFSVGQPVRLANPYPEMDPSTVFYVTGISWEHRMVSARGWNIQVASKEDIEKGYGQTDGYHPNDLLPLRSSSPAGQEAAKEGE